MRVAGVAALAVASLIGGCGPEPVTQIVVVIDTDMQVPVEIDAIAIRVEGPSTERTERTVPLGGTDTIPLPLTFGMVPATSALGPLTLTITGQLGDTTVVERVVRTRFLEGEARLLRIRLHRACIGAACPAEQTCVEGDCIRDLVPPEELPPFTGLVRVPELCNQIDDDDDGRTDEGFDLQIDAANCGACGTVCGAGRPCQAGGCVDSPLVAIGAGSSHTCAVREAGGVTCWGSNAAGELGNGTLIGSSVPVSVLALGDAREVSAGAIYSCAARADGTSACWGSGLGGELGIGVYENRQIPARTVGVDSARQTTAGFYHSCALLMGGGARCWGRGTTGELGNGAVVGMVPEPVNVVDLADATEIRVGFQHTCAVRSSGAVSCWGDNSAGQLGNGGMMQQSRPTPVMGISDAIGVATGETFSCAVLRGGGVSCWGANDAGQLGSDPAMVPSSTTPVPVMGLPEPMLQIGAGAQGRFVCARGSTEGVYCWGRNDFGQLGDGTMVTRFTPQPLGLAGVHAVSVGQSHACALLVSEGNPPEVWCWGEGIYGQLGDGMAANSAIPVRVVGL